VESKVDGRRARGQRTRDAIVTALMDLVSAGDVSPTAQRIAERAEVSVRSVYQHFTDIEGLFASAGNRIHAWAVEQVVEIDPDLPLGTRISMLTGTRAEILEKITPFSRAVRMLEPTSEALREWRLSLQTESRRHLERAFDPELSRLETTARDRLLSALDVLTTWQSWDHLRQAGASPDQARSVVASALNGLLGSGEGVGRELTGLRSVSTAN
jgi:AcrR family transcriptional regulator